MVEPWLQTVIDGFWKRAGTVEPFPRSLEVPVLWALPLAIFKLPRLWLSDAAAWLRERELPICTSVRDRRLRAFLVAYAGKGIILLDGTDDPAEQRFSLAHDVAHFLLDYWLPRQQAIAGIGPQIVEVLDGRRSPTLDERLNAIFRRCSVGPHFQLMDRAPDGLPARAIIRLSESRADRIAVELLAPAAVVRRRLRRTQHRPGDRLSQTKQVTDVLSSDFGLPYGVARDYAAWLMHRWYGGPSVREWLGSKSGRSGKETLSNFWE